MRRTQSNIARRKLEYATTTLLHRAACYQGIPGDSYAATQNMLEAAREYARAFRRVETLRRGS